MTQEPSDDVGRSPSSTTGTATLAPDADRVFRTLDLGQRLALARQQKGLTQKQLSELVGKSRATVVQYEQGRLQPPVQQIETMAKVLDVAPELIAFGRQGLTGLPSNSARVTSLTEVAFDGTEELVCGGHALGDTLLHELGIEPEGTRIFVLGQAAPAFGLAAGDRIIVNPGPTLSQDERLYALRTSSGVAVARLLPRLSASSSRVNLNGGHGDIVAHEPGELSVLGVVVGSIQKR